MMNYVIAGRKNDRFGTWMWWRAYTSIHSHVKSVHENPADCEGRGVIRFLQAYGILGYLAEEASSRVEFLCCTTIYVRTLPVTFLREQFHWDIFEHPSYSSDLAPSNFFPFANMKALLVGKRFANDEELKDAGWITRRPYGMERV